MPTCHLRFTHDMVSQFPSLLPRGVTVAQVTLDHFVMVRIHARQIIENWVFMNYQRVSGKKVVLTFSSRHQNAGELPP